MREQIVNNILAVVVLLVSVWASLWFAALVEPIYELPPFEVMRLADGAPGR